MFSSDEGKKELIQIVSEQSGINENTTFEVSIFINTKYFEDEQLSLG